MDERSQGATEYLLTLGAVLVVVAGVVSSIILASRALGSTIGDQIENARKEVIDGLTGMLRLLR